jgi:hypothetical protein
MSSTTLDLEISLLQGHRYRHIGRPIDDDRMAWIHFLSPHTLRCMHVGCLKGPLQIHDISDSRLCSAEPPSHLRPLSP